MPVLDNDPDKRTCTDCGLISPETETPYTLISAEHGWRVHFEVGPDGKKRPQWRCPACWSEYRKRKGQR